MTPDRNKTELTKHVTDAAIGYLDERGCKPIETEVYVSDGWIADVAAMLSPTVTELVKLRLVSRAPDWKDQNRQRWWEQARAMQKIMTVLVEVKTSRGDFISDRKWSIDPPCNLAYLAVPAALKLSVEELPKEWGILSVHDATVRLQQVPIIRDVSIEAQFKTVAQIAIRRDNATRYERLRELQREYTLDRAIQKSMTRVSTAMRVVQSIIAGKHGSVSGALEYHGVLGLGKYQIEELGRYWNMIPAPVKGQP